MNTTARNAADSRNPKSARKRATAIQALIVSRRLRAYLRLRTAPARVPAAAANLPASH